MKVLVTGSAGFIGFHLVEKLIRKGYEVIGLDNLNDYYDVNLKYARLRESGISNEAKSWNKLIQSNVHAGYVFIRMNLEDKYAINYLFQRQEFDCVINLAAQAGVRYSLENPDVYLQSNVIGFHNILEACRNFPVKHLLFASSSSVYGDSTDVPFSEKANVDKPVSLYAATKKSNELMAYTYSHLYGIPTTGLRFFTVYGPWGRPDMAMALFTERILKGEAIKVFNEGKLSRDFTYVSDIVEGIQKVIDHPNSSVNDPYQLLNIGNNSPVQLMDFIQAIEKITKRKALLDFQPMQDGDVHQTWADVSALMSITGYQPKVSIEEGIQAYVNWFQEYYTVV